MKKTQQCEGMPWRLAEIEDAGARTGQSAALTPSWRVLFLEVPAQIIFSEPVTVDTAGNRANYSLDGGLTISGITVANPTTVSSATAKQTEGTKYTVTVNNVKDLAGNTIAANAKATFSAFVLKRGGITFEAHNPRNGS